MYFLYATIDTRAPAQHRERDSPALHFQLVSLCQRQQRQAAGLRPAPTRWVQNLFCKNH